MGIELKANRLQRRRGPRLVLDDVSFSLQTGDYLVVLGSNGAGKTTLLRLLALLDRPASGAIGYSCDGQLLDPYEARAQIGFVSHVPMLYPDLSAQQNLELFASLYGVADPATRAIDLLDEVELAHRANDAVRGFSRGMTQRMAFARALVNDPAVLLLDEPYAGLDPHGAEIARSVLSTRSADRITIEVSHDMEAGLASATHVLILARGKVVLFGACEELGADVIRRRYADVLRGGLR